MPPTTNICISLDTKIRNFNVGKLQNIMGDLGVSWPHTDPRARVQPLTLLRLHWAPRCVLSPFTFARESLRRCHVLFFLGDVIYRDFCVISLHIDRLLFVWRVNLSFVLCARFPENLFINIKLMQILAPFSLYFRLSIKFINKNIVLNSLSWRKSDPTTKVFSI